MVQDRAIATMAD